MEILKFLFLFILGTIPMCTNVRSYQVNTSNLGKKSEFIKYLGSYNVDFSELDIKEPQADPFTIIRYKASQFKRSVLVDDVSFEVEGADFGVNIRWKLKDLEKEENLGRKASFICYMAWRKGDEIHLVSSTVKGTIVKKRGNGFGFGPYFLPLGARLTLGQKMDKKYNPRYIALQKLIQGRDVTVLPLLEKWKGIFQ